MKNLITIFSTILTGISSLPAHAETTVTLQNPLPVNTPAAFVGLVLNTVLGLSGIIALIVFVYGGILWMTSAGDKGKVSKGIDSMIWAAIGMAVVFASAAIVRFLLIQLGAK